MPVLFDPTDIKRVLTAKASEYCSIKLLKEGKFGERMTRAGFKAHKDCIRDVWKDWVNKRIAELTIPTLPTPAPRP